MNISDFRLVLFESSLRKNYYPLSLTKPIFDLTFGIGSLLDTIENYSSLKISDLFVPPYLEDLTIKNHTEKNVNQHIASKCLLINSQISIRASIWKFIEASCSQYRNTLFFDSEMTPVFGILEEASPERVSRGEFRSSGKRFLPSEVDKTALMKYPWNLVNENGKAIVSGLSKSSTTRARLSNFELRGDRIMVSPSADIEQYVTFDTRSGPIVIEDESDIQSFSHLMGPCFIGKRTKLKSARIRGNCTIGKDCRVSGEVEESILSDFTNKSHDGFIGHSYLGSWVNLGALTTNSDLKNTYGNVKVRLGRKKIDTGMMKVGVYLGDMAKTAIGTMITSGCKVGVSSHVFGTVMEDVPSFTIFTESMSIKSVEQYLKSAIETQTRVMKRRGVEIGDEYIAMMKYLFKKTRTDRTANKIRKGKIKLR